MSLLISFHSSFKGLELVNKATCRSFQDVYVKYNQKLSFAMRMVELYSPYLLFKGMYVLNLFPLKIIKIEFFLSLKLCIDTNSVWKCYICSFDDTNTEELRRVTRDRFIEAESFNFDPTSIDWEDYIMNTHIPGFLKHVLFKWSIASHGNAIICEIYF